MIATVFEETSIYQLIADQATKYPEKLAVKHNENTIDYKNLILKADQFAAFLKEKQIKQNDLVVVAMDRSIEMQISLIGFLKSGVAYLPILPDYPKERLNYILSNSQTTHILSSHKYQSQFAAYPGVIYIEDFLEQCSSYTNFELNTTNLSESTAFALYTSGSTGVPKGVEIAQKSFLNHLQSMALVPGINANDIMLSITTITFDIAQLELFLPLISGAQVYISDMDESRDGRLLLETIEKEKISIVQATPFNWLILIESGWQKKLPIKALCGGEALSKDLANKLCANCNELWNVYGPTEATIWATLKQIRAEDPFITIGKPIHNMGVYILDENLKQLPVDEIGEIYITGAGVGKGYINRPELTEKAFLHDPFIDRPGVNMYKTGDLGKLLENGEIQCLGRIDHQIKIRGNRVETEEIEFQLKKADNVKNAIVVGHNYSKDNMRLLAYIELKSKITEDEESAFFKYLKNSLAESLPEYMIPTDYMIIEEVPLMVNGKVNRKALPIPVVRESDNKIVAPESDFEKAMLGIWMKNIGINKISVEDNFFDLGGNSLVATKIMIQVEEMTGRRLPNATLFQYQTIKELCKAIENNEAQTDYKVLVSMKPAGTKIPVYFIHAIGLNLLFIRNMVQLMDEDQPVFGLQALGLNGNDEPLDNMEEIARYYNNEIIKHNPNGPYIIIGYSFGGYIAFEMVRQLKAMGKDVRMLGMIDSNIQEALHKYTLNKMVSKKLMRQVYKLNFRIGSMVRSPKDNLNYFKIVYTNKFKKFLNKDFDSEDMPVFMMRIADKMEHAYYHYEFKPTDVKIVMFTSEKRLFFIDDPVNMGWGPYALEGVEKHIIPGDHKDMLFPPNVQIFATELQKKLNELN